MGQFEVFKSTANNQFYYRLRATGNSEIIISGEGYTTRQSCYNGIESVKANSPYDFRYDRKNGITNYTFVLKANNGEIIGRSENYNSLSARENGISAVKRDAPDAPIQDFS